MGSKCILKLVFGVCVCVCVCFCVCVCVCMFVCVHVWVCMFMYGVCTCGVRVPCMYVHVIFVRACTISTAQYVYLVVYDIHALACFYV